MKGYPNHLQDGRLCREFFSQRGKTDKTGQTIVHATGVVRTSLYMAAQDAGIPGSLTEEYYLNGEIISCGNILATEFVNQGVDNQV